ncbi:MAG TPA: hypothetical protein PK440_09285 [Candidatus Accumulibacter phosphatis]|nr:hypothetical protein [Candidatus Accumulibacter phosphatis]
MSSELHFFAIHALDGRAAQEELNGFLAQHRVLTIEKQWLAAGLDSHRVVCVGVANGPGALPDAAVRWVPSSILPNGSVAVPMRFRRSGQAPGATITSVRGQICRSRAKCNACAGSKRASF